MDPYRLTGLQSANVPSPASSMPGIERSAGPSSRMADNPPWSPDNPLFWFGLFALATFGAIAGSTSLRVGPFRASAGVGNS